MIKIKSVKMIVCLSLVFMMAISAMPITAYAKGYEASSTPFTVDGYLFESPSIEINPDDDSRIIKITRPCTVVAAFECKNSQQAIGGIIPMPMSLNYEILLNDSIDESAYNDSSTPSPSRDSGDFEYVKYTVTKEDIADAGGVFTLYCRVRSYMYPEKTLSEIGQKYTFDIKIYENEFEQLAGHTLSLDGNIGVNFYMLLADVIANSETAYMHFMLADGNTQDVSVSEARQATVNGNNCLVFSCDVPAKNMTDTITAQIIDGNKVGKEYTYTVKEYAEYLFENQDNAEYVKAAPMIKAMLNYGAYAQLHFNYNTNHLANDTAYMTDAEKDVSAVTADTLSEYKNQSEQKCDYFRFEGATLDLLSQTTLRLWFTADKEKMNDFTIISYMGDKTFNMIESGNYYCLDVSNITAKELDSDFVIRFEDGNYVWFCRYNVMSYAYNVLERETTSLRTDQLKDTIRALYLYNQAAKEYFNQ